MATASVESSPSKLLQPGRCAASPHPKGSLRLLELPLDIQQNVVDLVAGLSPPNDGMWESEEATDWSDLKNLGLTCRKLYLLAAPIYQRHLCISSYGLFKMKKGTSSAYQLAEHCRRMSRCLRMKHVTSLFFGATYYVDSPTQKDIRALKNASRELIERTPGLKILSVSGQGASVVISATLGHRMESLTKLCVGCSSGSLPKLDTYQCLSQLRTLELSDFYPDWLRALAKMTHLEDLTISDEDYYSCPSLDLCEWPEQNGFLGTLRRLRLRCYNKEKMLVGLFRKIKAYREKALPFVLEELHVDARVTRAVFDEMVGCLAGHSGLQALSLSLIPLHEMSPSVIEDIAGAGLVTLRRLLLVTKWDYGGEWPSGIEAYVEPLSKLPYLHTIIYNHLGDDESMATLPAYYDEEPLMTQAEMFFSHCPALQTVFKVDPIFSAGLWQRIQPCGYKTSRGSKVHKREDRRLVF